MRLAIHVACLAIGLATHVHARAAEQAPNADFLLVGSYHMDNPGRDVHNTRADDVTSETRQREMQQVVRLLQRYKPTKVMVEVDAAKQATLQAQFDASCKGNRALTRNETEQLAFRIACNQGLPGVIAVNWNGLGPIKDEDSVDYRKAVERHGQQRAYQAHLAIGTRENAKRQEILDQGTILDMLRHLNSHEYLIPNAHAYHRIGMLGTADDPIGANWVQLWYGRNLRIFNNIARHTEAGDRVLVIYGAGHGNHLRQLATDSGLYRVHDTTHWLSGESPDHTAANH